jgi:hypothetical protein
MVANVNSHVLQNGAVSYPTLPQEGQIYLARAFLSKKNVFADVVAKKIHGLGGGIFGSAESFFVTTNSSRSLSWVFLLLTCRC